MTFTYTAPDGSGVFATPRDNVRFLAEDTVESPQSVDDEEIAYLLGVNAVPLSGPAANYQPGIRQTAAQVARVRADKWDRFAAGSSKNKRVGDLQLGDRDYASVAASLRELAERLVGGGDDPTAITPMILDPNATNPTAQQFGIGMDDFPGTFGPRGGYLARLDGWDY